MDKVEATKVAFKPSGEPPVAGWAVYGESDENGHDIDKPFHVLPVNDLKAHDMSAGCWCRPRLDEGIVQEEEREVYVHNSYDRREHTYERGHVH